MSYAHTQYAPLCWILSGSALVCLGTALALGDSTGWWIAGAVALLLLLVASAFHHLTVRDEGDVLALRFGPLPLFRRTVRYADIARVEMGRTWLLEGWGIHLSLRGGWVWNLWGRACVVVHFHQGGVLRIGTDDPVNLAQFLTTRVGPVEISR